MAAEFVLAQISDCHIGAATADPEGGLARALAAIAPYRPDAILATGDLANDGAPAQYARLRAVLADAPAPVFLMNGNHDDPAALRAAFPDHAYLPDEAPFCYTIDHLPVRIVALDATVFGLDMGVFPPELGQWLQMALAEDPGAPTILALHHPPFATHDRLFDSIGLEGAEMLGAIVSRHRQIVRVVCGHHHRMISGLVGHAPCTVAPSTAWAFGLALDDAQPIAQITAEPPGFLIHAWSRAGGASTAAVFV